MNALPHIPRAASLLLIAILGVTQSPTASAAESTNPAPPKVHRDRIDPHWFGDTNRFWYRVTDRDRGEDYIVVDAVSGERRPAFDSERLAKALSEFTRKPVKSGAWPFTGIEPSAERKSIRLTGGDEAWSLDLDSYQIQVAESGDPKKETPPAERRRNRGRSAPSPKSPDGKWQTFVREHNLWLRNLETKEERALSTGASAEKSFLKNVQRDRSIDLEYDTSDPESDLPDVYWAPDSRSLIGMQTRPGTQRRVYLVESSPKDQLQPKLQSYPYLKPGDDIPIRKPHLFSIDAPAEIPVSDSLFENPWSISEVRWSADSSRFTFLYNQRGHQVLRIVEVDARNGSAHPIVDEHSATFIDYAGKSFSEYLDGSDEIIWMSERDGWNHLYLYDRKTATVRNQITRGEWVVRGVERVDREARQIWFRAGGIRPGQNPYYIHYCRVDFDGRNLVILTAGDGTHSLQFSPDRRFFIDTWSRVDLPPIHELRRSHDGTLVCELERADASAVTAQGRTFPERFVAMGRDGTTPIYGVIHRPKNFDASKKYAVIESIYAGPHGSFVPTSFRAAYNQERLADRGFIIVQIDGMGTSHRSKKFHDICWKNIGDSGFPDRILWMKAAAAKYPCMDLSRVGVYGGSAGGQSALRALLAFGDFYKAAASDCGCHDNRMDKIWWNELWMGWPVGPHYDEQSNVTQAHKLQGKLLLTVAELDRNVDPSSTFQVVNALEKAGKDFELIIFPGAGHGAGDSPYGQRRRADFFERSLGKQSESSNQ